MITQEFKGFGSPPGNTGLKCQKRGVVDETKTVSVDWITITFKCKNFQDFESCADYIGGFLDDRYTYNHNRGIKKGKWFASSGRSARGTLLCYSFPAGFTEPGEGLISINSESLAAARNSREVWRMCRGLAHMWSVRCSRFDIALDDYSKSLPYELVYEAAELGNYARADKYHPFPGELLRGVEPTNTACRGWTINFGSRKSDKFIRYYNKAFKSGGEIDAYRLEVEFKKDRSDLIFQEYVGIPPESFSELSAPLLANYVIGAIDFVDRQSGDRLQRQDQLQWWSDFCSSIGTGIRTPSRQSKPLISKKIAWIKRSVETSLSLLQDALGAINFYPFLKECIRSGKKRYTKEHLALLEVFLMEKDLNTQYLEVSG